MDRHMQSEMTPTVEGALGVMMKTELLEGENAYDAGPDRGGKCAQAFRVSSLTRAVPN